MNKLLVYLSFVTIVNASEYSDMLRSMQSFKKEQTNNITFVHKQNIDIVTQNKKYYSKISTQATAYYNKYISKKWGKDNVKLSNKTTFTQYNEQMDERQSVDFEHGLITVEIVSDEKIKVNPEYFDKTIETFSQESVSQAVKKDPVVVLETKYMEKKAVVAVDNNINDNSKFLSGYIEQKKITPDDIKEKKVIMKNGDNKYIYYVDVKMVPDHLKKRALKFKPYVLKKSREYGVEPSVIFATIQTESYFNPLAKSHVPAYGLMQIVPTTAGIDAYYALTKKKKLLSPSYLYNAENNIELGSKYIQIIREQYLKGITNPESRFYCAATSYNAGIGSLFYAFTGSKSKRLEAIRMINSMTPERVYNHLRTSTRLSYEARNYVKNIKDRSENYKVWDKEV
jgi:membrane-bound lytic murein transglycosylase C